MSDSVRPHQALRSLGFSRQEHWNGLPFPSPMRESEVTQSCPTIRNPMDGSPPGSSVHGIFQARALEWVPLPSPPYFAAAAAAKSLQSCPTLCDPTRLPHSWDSAGKNTGVGCHCLLHPYFASNYLFFTGLTSVLSYRFIYPAVYLT